jgi:hypothetical protein
MTVTINGTTGASLIQDGTVTSAKIVDGSIAPADLTGGQSGSAPIYGCRAWVNFVGATGVINASGNVSGVTRNSTGNYTVTFTTAMPDVNYSVVVGSTGLTGSSAASSSQTPLTISQTTSSFTVVFVYGGGAANDPVGISLAIFR